MELESTPLIALFDYVLRVVDTQEKSSASTTKFDVRFTRNGETLAASGPVVRSDNGYWEIPLRTVFLPRGLLVLEIFNASHETGRHDRLGLVFVDLDETFFELDVNVAIECVYDVVLESDDLPRMQCSWVAALFQDTYFQFPERRMPPFVDAGIGDGMVIRVHYPSVANLSRPTVTLFNFTLTFAEVENSESLFSSSIKIILVHDETTVFESDSVKWDIANKCWIIKVAVTFSGNGIVVVNLSEYNANIGTKKLGSTYIDLDTVSAADGLLTDYTEDVFLDSDDAPAMKFRYHAALFPISGIARLLKLQWIPHFLFFEPCSDTTSPAAFKKYCRELQHLLCRNKISLVITPEQAEQLATRCRFAPDFTMNDQSYFFFLLPDIAELQFYFVSRGRMNLLSRLCDQYFDMTTITAGLQGTELDFLVSSVTSLPRTYPAKTTLALQFGSCLAGRYMGVQDENDLAQAICLLETAEQLQQWAHPGDVKQRNLYSELASAYALRYNLSKRLTDLDLSLAASDRLASGMLIWGSDWANDEEQSEVWHSIAMNMLGRFGILGTRQDVDRALECVDKALALVPQHSPSRLEYLDTRASALYGRYSVLGDAVALESSLEIRKRLSLPSSHPAYATAMFREGQALFARAWHTLREFHGEFRDEHFERSLNELKGMRRLTARESADLERAITLSRKFIDAHPNHSDIDNFLWLLGESLFTHYLCQKDRRDLDECVAALKRVSSEKQSNSLAHALFLQEDFQSSIAVFTKASTSTTLPPTYRLFAATCGAEIVLKRTHGTGRVSACMSLLRTAMALLPRVVWIGMRVLDRYNVLMSWKTAFNTTYVPTQSANRGPRSGGVFFTVGQVPSLAAGFAFEFGELRTAVEWLEQGRSIIWDQLLQFRIPLEDLKRQNLGLANSLNAVARDLAVSSARTLSPGEDTSEDEKHRELVAKWEAGVAEARMLPGFKDFLMPKNYAYLSAAANDSVIVIINVDWSRCDALVIFPPSAGGDSSLHHVPLRADVDFISNVGKTYMELVELTRSPEPFRKAVFISPEALDPNAKFIAILSELWYQIVLPILVSCQEERPLLFTGMTGGPRPRVRWCPTGRLTFLPLHAAGDYSSSQKGHKVYDFVISSYIPTLSSIIRPPSSGQKPNILAVSCATPKGYVPIFGTQKELGHVEQCAESSGCEIVAIREDEATADRVLEAMNCASWVHFACHGIQNAENPTESALILQDGTSIKLTDFASLDLPHAEFAYLSACQTATGHAKLPSESVHLAAGMLLAGYRSVIATMWSIKDKYAPEVAADVYGYLLRKGKDRPDHKDSALALDIAVERLRAKAGEKEFFSWVPYIHIGA